MNRTKIILLLTGAVYLLLGCDSTPFRQVLDRAEQQNAAYDSITGIDSIQMAADYMDRHGTPNEQLRAHYLLGCAYRDAGEAPKALAAYHDAADRADTTSADCDYGLLMRLHGQTSELFYQQLLPHEMLRELSAQYHYALLTGNKKAATNAIERRANAYQLLNMPDSIISIRQTASERYALYGFTEEAAQALGPIIELLVDRGDTAEARRCIKRYETSTAFFKDGEPIARKAHYYYAKGRYYLAVGKTDAAEILFRKLITPERTPNQLEAGYRGLLLLYHQTGRKDSIVRYADLFYQMSTSNYATSTSDKLQQMTSLYNYSRSQQLAQQMAEKAHRHEMMLYIIGSLAVVLLMLAVMAWQYLQQKRQEERKQFELLLLEYHTEKEALAKALDNVRLLNENVEEKELSISNHKKRIEELEEQIRIKRNKTVNEQLTGNPAYMRTMEVLANPKDQMSQKDWAELTRMMDEMIPEFRTKMKYQERRLSEMEYVICILVRLFFTPKEIAVLTGNSQQAISMKRLRLLKKVYDIDGSAEAFDKLVRSIGR